MRCFCLQINLTPRLFGRWPGSPSGLDRAIPVMPVPRRSYPTNLLYRKPSRLQRMFSDVFFHARASSTRICIWKCVGRVLRGRMLDPEEHGRGAKTSLFLIGNRSAAFFVPDRFCRLKSSSLPGKSHQYDQRKDRHRTRVIPRLADLIGPIVLPSP